MIKKGGAWLKIHEQVKIAVWASLSPSDRAEHGDPMSPALPRDAEDLRAAAAQPLKSQHVIGHPSRVSPRALATLRTASERAPRRAIRVRRAEPDDPTLTRR